MGYQSQGVMTPMLEIWDCGDDSLITPTQSCEERFRSPFALPHHNLACL